MADPPKSKRPDVAKRKLEAKEQSTTVVKTTLNSITKYPITKLIIEDVLYDSNKALFEAYLFSNYHILRTINIFQNTKNIEVLREINQDYYYKCLSIVSEGSNERSEIKDPILRESAYNYKFLRQNTPLSNSANLSLGVFQNLSLQMETNSLNAFESRTLILFNRYLRHRYDLDYRKATNIINNILTGKNKDITSTNPIGNPIVQYYIEYFNEFSSIAPKQLKKNEKYLPIIEKWTNEINAIRIKIAKSENKNYIEALEFSISEIYNKIENAAEYCKNYSLLKDTRFATVLLHRILEYNGYMQNNGVKDKKVRLFSLLPTKGSFTMNHIAICNAGLYNIIRRGLNNEDTRLGTERMLEDIKTKITADFLVEALKDNPDTYIINDLTQMLEDIGDNIFVRKIEHFTEYSDYYWNYLFNIPKSKKTFTGYIQTDGKAVSITLKSPKIIKEEYSEINTINKILEDPNWITKCVGADPGYHKVLTMSRMDDNTKSFEVSSKKYYSDSKFTESNIIMKHKLHNNVIVREIVKNIPSSKTANIETLEQYICFIVPKVDILMNFYTKMKIRDLAFKRYCFSKKAIDDITNGIIKKNGSQTIVGFGDFSNNGCIKAVKGPVKKIERALQRKCIVVSISEFRSSKLSHEYQTLMKHRSSHSIGKNGKTANHQIYNVLYCNNNEKNSISIDRDVNASQNILEILIYLIQTGKRHPAFEQSRKLEEPFNKIENQYNFRRQLTVSSEGS